MLAFFFFAHIEQLFTGPSSGSVRKKAAFQFTEITIQRQQKVDDERVTHRSLGDLVLLPLVSSFSFCILGPSNSDKRVQELRYRMKTHNQRLRSLKSERQNTAKRRGTGLW